MMVIGSLSAADLLVIARRQGTARTSGLSHSIHDLYVMARTARSVLELGTGHGASTLAFYAALRENGGQLTTIDLDPNSPGAELVRRLGLSIDLVTGNALVWTPPKIYDIIFVDDEHSDAHIRAEIVHYLPYLSAGGLLVLHDTNALQIPGPRRVLNEMVRAGRLRLLWEDRKYPGLAVLTR